MSLRKIITLSFFTIICNIANTQVCFQLEISENSKIEKDITLQVSAFQNGIATKVVDQVLTAKPTLKAVIELPFDFHEGIYLVSINGQKFFEIILTYKEMPILIGTINDFNSGSVMVKDSRENEAYYSFLNISSKLDKESEQIRDKRLEITSVDANYYTQHKQLEQETFKLQQTYNEQLNTLKSSFENSYTANQIVPIAKIPTPNSIQLEKYETNESFLRDYYLKNLNLYNDAIFNNYIPYNKLKLYLEVYTPVGDLYHKKSIEKILNEADKNPMMLQNIVAFLMDYYYKERRDELVLYVYNLYNSNFCSYEYDNLNVDELIQNLKLNRIGNKVHELYLPNEKGELVSLINVVNKNRATILLFWSADCSVCMQELPHLKALYHKYKSKGLAIYAVNLDLDKTKWHNAIRENSLDWFNLNELKPKNQSQVEQKYKIRQTPTLFVIDDESKIVAKDVFGLELETSIGIYINKNGLY